MRLLVAVIGSLILSGCTAPQEPGAPSLEDTTTPEPKAAPRELAFEPYVPCDAEPRYRLERAIYDADAFMDSIWRGICHPFSLEGDPSATWAPPPAIDFTTHTIFAAYLGPRLVNGWTARIDRIMALPGETLVTVKVGDPGTCPVTLGPVNPGEFVIAERADQGSAIRFEYDVETGQCDAGGNGWRRVGAWLFRTPESLEGYMGEVVDFAVEVRPSPGGTEASLRQDSPWTYVGNETIFLNSTPMTVHATTIIGPDPYASFTIRDLLDESVGIPVVVKSRPGITPIGGLLQSGLPPGPTTGPRGLSVTTTGDRAVIAFALGPPPTTELCAERVLARGPFQLWNMSGQPTIVGFVTLSPLQTQTTCSPPSDPGRRLVIRAFALPEGRIDVALHVFRQGCCDPRSWETLGTTFEVMG